MAGTTRFRRGSSCRLSGHPLRRLLYVALAVVVFFAAPAHAQVPPAERSYEEFGVFSVDRSHPEAIYLNGPISDASILDFRRARRAYPDARILVLNSPGGMAGSGLAIADEVHEAGFSTVIPSWAGCYSACSFLFFAGVERLAVGELGVHQFTGDNPDYDVAQRMVADVLEILARFDTPQPVISLMLRTPPDDMYVFTPAEIDQYGINRGFAEGDTAYEEAGGPPVAAADNGLTGVTLIVDPNGINERRTSGSVAWDTIDEDGQNVLLAAVDLGRGEVSAGIIISAPLDPTELYGVIVGVLSEDAALLGDGDNRTVELWVKGSDGEVRPTTLGGGEFDAERSIVYLGGNRRWLALDLSLIRDAVAIDLVFKGGSAPDAILSIPLADVVSETASGWLEQAADMPLGDRDGPRTVTPVAVRTASGSPPADATITWYTYGPSLGVRLEIPSQGIWADLSFTDESALMVFYPPEAFADDAFRVALLGADWEAYDVGVFVAQLADPSRYLDSVSTIDLLLELASGENLVVSLPKNAEYTAMLAEAARSWNATETTETPLIVDAPDADLEQRIVTADVQAGGSTATQCVACHSLTRGGGTRNRPQSL